MSIEAAVLGILSRDGEARTSKAGRQYLRLNVRVGDGDTAQWINVICFDSSAIGMADRFVAGARVYAEGRLTANGWTDSDGNPRANLSVLSGHTRLCEIGRHRSKRRARRGTKPAPAAGAAFYNDEIPFAPEVK